MMHKAGNKMDEIKFYNLSDETIKKLKSIFMLDEIKRYVEIPSLINIDAFDLNNLFLDKKVIFSKQGIYRLEKFKFSYKIPGNTSLFVGIDGNRNMDLKMIDKIIDEIRQNVVNVEVLYSTYYDDTLRDGLVRLNLINTMVTEKESDELNFNDEDYEKLALEIAEKLSPIHDLSGNDKERLKELGLLEEFCSYKDKVVLKAFDDRKFIDLFSQNDINTFFIGVVNKEYNLEAKTDSEYAFAKIKCNANLPIKYINNLITSFTHKGIFLYYGLYIDESLKDDEIYIACLELKPKTSNSKEVVNDTNIINNEVYEKLMSVGLSDVLDNYLDIYGIINIDFADVVEVVHQRSIANYFNGNITLDGPITFNFLRNNNSKTLLIIEANENFSYKNIERIIKSINEKLNNTEIIYGFYSNERIEPNQARIVIVNTVDNVQTENKTIESVDNAIDEEYNLDDVLKQCKENNNYSINFIQSITNLGFNECHKIKEKLMKIK